MKKRNGMSRLRDVVNTNHVPYIADFQIDDRFLMKYDLDPSALLKKNIQPPREKKPAKANPNTVLAQYETAINQNKHAMSEQAASLANSQPERPAVQMPTMKMPQDMMELFNSVPTVLWITLGVLLMLLVAFSFTGSGKSSEPKSKLPPIPTPVDAPMPAAPAVPQEVPPLSGGGYSNVAHQPFIPDL